MERINGKSPIARPDGRSRTHEQIGRARVNMLSRGRKLFLCWLAPMLVVAILLTGVGQGIAFAADGDLDPTFGGDGLVTTGLGSTDTKANAVAIQSNGKIVEVGSIDGGSYQGEFFVARYNTDGSLDGSFGYFGLHTIDFGSDSDTALAVAIQADGKIVVAGYTGDGTSDYDFAIARLNTDGSNDTTFSGDGKTTTDFAGRADFANAVAIQSDGKIVAAGDAYIFSSPAEMALARYNTNGSLDTTFDGDGLVTTYQIEDAAYFKGVAIQSNGKIVAAGYEYFNPTTLFIVARYNTNGSLDTTFGGYGVNWYTFDEGDGQANAVAIQSGGRIVVAGYVVTNTSAVFALARLNSDGSLDTTFSGDGKVTTDFGTGFARADGVAIQSDGKIVAAGAAYTASSYTDFALARYNTNGNLDTTFGGDGLVTTDFAQSDDTGTSVAIQPNGKIVAGGYACSVTDCDFALARYQSGGAPSPTPTRTPQPTQTPGGPSATPEPSNTPTPPVQATPTSCPIQFTDVPSGSTFYANIRCLACRGIINGYPDNTFRPNNNVTRGQLSKIISNAAGFNDPQTTQMFEDVPVGSTFFDYIGRLASRGYIGGYPCGGVGEPCNPPGNLPYFRPNSNATRGQIAKIDSNAAEFADPPVGQAFEDVPVGSTFYTFTQRLSSRNIMSGYPCGGLGELCNPPGNLPYFRPAHNATRGQIAKIVSNTFYPDCNPPRKP